MLMLLYFDWSGWENYWIDPKRRRQAPSRLSETETGFDHLNSPLDTETCVRRDIYKALLWKRLTKAVQSIFGKHLIDGTEAADLVPYKVIVDTKKLTRTVEGEWDLNHSVSIIRPYKKPHSKSCLHSSSTLYKFTEWRCLCILNSVSLYCICVYMHAGVSSIPASHFCV